MYGNYFVILDSDGEHVFKRREASRLQDSRGKGIEYGGYLISFRNGHVEVRIDDESYEPYSSIRRQMFNILREVNRVRKVVGFEQIPSSAIWLKRRILKPFEGQHSNNLAA